MRLLPLLLGILCLIPISSPHARPVSYPDGWTLMQMNDANSHALHWHYSPTARYSVGYKAQYWRAEDWQFHGLQLNYLVKRWNAHAAQANIYLKSGAGIAISNYQSLNSHTEAAAFTGLAMDWENRRFFTSYENHLLYAGDIDKHFTQKARIGFAPYVGDYGDLHTWLMLQANHDPTAQDELTLTPLLRFFKGEYLAEIGLSTRGDALFNWVIRF